MCPNPSYKLLCSFFTNCSVSFFGLRDFNARQESSQRTPESEITVLAETVTS